MGKASRKKKDKKFDIEIAHHVMTNSQMMAHQLTMFSEMLHTSVLENCIGIMEAMNTETGAPELLIVGLEPVGDKFDCYPLAKIFSKDEVGKYLAPDGRGGYWKKAADGLVNEMEPEGPNVPDVQFTDEEKEALARLQEHDRQYGSP